MIPLRPASEDGMDLPIGRLMSTALFTTTEDELVTTVARRMADRRVGCAIVVSRHKPVQGIFTERDLLMRVVGAGRNPALTAIGDVMTRDVATVDAAMPLLAAWELTAQHGFRHLPVLEHGRLAGVVSMRDILRVRLRAAEALADQETRALQQVQRLFALGLEERTRELLDVNRRLEELALTDHLTGLFNHRYFAQRLRDEAARARRHAAPLALVCLDIDHFKRVNDAHGHPVGDLVLKHVATVLRGAVEGTSVLARLRKSEVIARNGGEEFALLLPDTSLQGAYGIAERVRAAVARAPLALASGEALTVTLSAGVAAYARGEGDEDALAREADVALYRAKAGGRNRVELASDEAQGRIAG